MRQVRKLRELRIGRDEKDIRVTSGRGDKKDEVVPVDGIRLEIMIEDGDPPEILVHRLTSSQNPPDP
jgi:hypothetical protein